MKEIRLKIFKKYESDLKKEIYEIIKEIQIDPMGEIIKAHIDFNKFLEKYQGKQRTSEEAMESFNEISQRKDHWDKLKDKYTFEYKQRLQNKLITLESELSEIAAELYFLSQKI